MDARREKRPRVSLNYDRARQAQGIRPRAAMASTSHGRNREKGQDRDEDIPNPPQPYGTFLGLPEDKTYHRERQQDQIPLDKAYISWNYGTRAALAEDLIRRSNAGVTNHKDLRYPELKGLKKVPSLVECAICNLAYSLDWADLGTWSTLPHTRPQDSSDTIFTGNTLGSRYTRNAKRAHSN